LKKVIRCIFCDRIQPRSREHIIPEWLQVFIGGSTKCRTTGIHVAANHLDIIDERRGSGNNHVYGGTCEDCNSRWMNSMETKARPCLKQLILNEIETGEWSSDNSDAIARWTYKTALMVNCGTNYRQIVPIEHYHHFRETGAPCSGTYVEVAFADTDENSIETAQTQVPLTIRPIKSLDDYAAYRDQSYVIILRLRRILLRVVYWPLNECSILSHDPDAFHRIHPFQGVVPFNFTKKFVNIHQARAILADCSEIVTTDCLR